jgi:hypothetical protein
LFPPCQSRRACRGPGRCWTCRSRSCRRCPPSPHRASGRTRLHAAFARSASYSIKKAKSLVLIITLNYYCTMKQLDQGYLHPKLEVPGLTCPGREFGNRSRASKVGGEHSREEPFEQLVNSNSEHLNMRARDQWSMLATVQYYFCTQVCGSASNKLSSNSFETYAFKRVAKIKKVRNPGTVPISVTQLRV